MGCGIRGSVVEGDARRDRGRGNDGHAGRDDSATPSRLGTAAMPHRTVLPVAWPRLQCEVCVILVIAREVAHATTSIASERVRLQTPLLGVSNGASM